MPVSVGEVFTSRFISALSAQTPTGRELAHIPGLRLAASRIPVLVRDVSSLSKAEFWLTMENNRWTHPYDSQGQRMAFSDMREHVQQLADDEFRSLSAVSPRRRRKRKTAPWTRRL
ncbi:ParB/Srx family N-terminal domain-containing protein [Paraburkholderia sp. SIMBA_054]|uniref:ParB/Srx family N-terminal domain-containing protein n=1 Tax=Paraburkholderia sp. SIMBA_054 TaxID=3085795 RepID=UPI00397890D3